MNTETRMKAAVAIVTGALMSVGAVGQVIGADLGVSTGVEYSVGQYGGIDDIEEFYVPLTFRSDVGRIGLRLTVPYLSVSTTAAALPIGPGMDPAPGPDQTVTESGLGDVIGALTLYDVYMTNSANFVVDLTGKVKFATADETRGLGTGENDYTVQFDAYRFFDRLSLQGSAGYRFRGSPPGVDLNDVLLASVGGTYLASDNTVLGIYYDYRETAISGLDDIQEVSGFASFRLNRAWRIEVYAFSGLTDSSADFGGGLMISTDLRQLRASERQDY